MTFEDFIDLYDNWNGMVKVNDNQLEPIIECPIIDLIYSDSKNSSIYKEIKNIKMKAFGFIPDLSGLTPTIHTLTVRLDCLVRRKKNG